MFSVHLTASLIVGVSTCAGMGTASDWLIIGPKITSRTFVFVVVVVVFHLESSDDCGTLDLMKFQRRHIQ